MQTTQKKGNQYPSDPYSKKFQQQQLTHISLYIKDKAESPKNSPAILQAPALAPWTYQPNLKRQTESTTYVTNNQLDKFFWYANKTICSFTKNKRDSN